MCLNYNLRMHKYLLTATLGVVIQAENCIKGMNVLNSYVHQDESLDQLTNKMDAQIDSCSDLVSIKQDLLSIDHTKQSVNQIDILLGSSPSSVNMAYNYFQPMMKRPKPSYHDFFNKKEKKKTVPTKFDACDKKI